MKIIEVLLLIVYISEAMSEGKNISDLIYNTFPTPVLLLSSTKHTFKIDFANKASENFFNVAKESIIGFEVTDLISFLDIEQSTWRQFLFDVGEQKQEKLLSINGILANSAGSNSFRYLELIASPGINDYKIARHIAVFINDITDKVVAQNELATFKNLLDKNEKFLNETQRVSRNGTWEIDLKTKNVLWSDMMREIFELRPDTELNFETAFSFYKDQETKDRVLLAVQEAIETGGVFDIESEIISGKGNQFWLRSTGKAELLNGVCTRLYGTAQDITERKKTKNQLIASHNRQESLIQSIEGIVWEADARTLQFTFVSNQVKRVLGYTPEQWLKDPDFWSKHIYPDDRDQAISFCTKQTASARNHTFDYRMVKSDGGVVWIKDVVSVITERGKPSLLRGIMVDITETKLMDELDDLERNVLELNSKKGVDTEIVLSEYLSGLENIVPTMKCSLLRVADRKIFNWVSPSLPNAYLQSINGLSIGLNAGSCGTSAFLKQKVIVGDIENDFRWIDFKHLILPYSLRSCWSYPVIDSEGETIAVFSVYFEQVKLPDAKETDLLERSVSLLKVILENRLYEAKIIESNLLINQGQELANFGNWQWDIVNNVVTWSDVLYKIYGLDKVNFTGTFEGYLSRLHPDDKERVCNIINDVLEKHNDIIFEERIIRPDGEQRTLRSWGRLMLTEDGKPSKMIGACLDITNVKAAQVKLEEIAWLQSHVIRAPLARLVGLIDILKNELAPGTPHDDLLTYIIQTSDELDKVIRDISGKAVDN